MSDQPMTTEAAQASPDESEAHPDDISVDRFSAAMKTKLSRKRQQGFGGWDDRSSCSNAHLSQLLRDHVDKGDPVDVANFAMMIHQRSERVAPDYPEPARRALRIAIGHIEHMAAWIGRLKSGYSFEGLSEDMPGLREALESEPSHDAPTISKTAFDAAIAEIEARHRAEIADMALRFRSVNVGRVIEQLGLGVPPSDNREVRDG